MGQDCDQLYVEKMVVETPLEHLSIRSVSMGRVSRKNSWAKSVSESDPTHTHIP